MERSLGLAGFELLEQTVRGARVDRAGIIVRSSGDVIDVLLQGVTSMTDKELKQHVQHALSIRLQAPTTSIRTSDVAAKIEAAFRRSAEVDARRINVTVQDGKVTLNGNVHSWAERQEAERAAWAAPGVTEVDDRLAVVP